MAKPPPLKTALELVTTLDDPHFALSADADFASLISQLVTLPGGPYDYAYVTTNASTPGIIKIGDDLAGLNGLIATGNGKDDIDLSNSTGNNLVYAGNGVDKVTGGQGNDIEYGGNGKDTLAGGTDNGTAVVTFAATDTDGASVPVLSANSPVLQNAAVLSIGAAGTGNDLVEEGGFVDTSTAPDTINHVFSFAPTDVGSPGGATAFVVGVFDSDGSLVNTFNVNMTEGVKNFFSLVD